MMSIGSAPPAADAADYYGKDNYYVDDDPERVEGEWFGAGAKALGLTGKVDLKQFEEVLAGRLPNGVTLGKKQGGERVHHPGEDLTFSMPKSAALLATVGGDKRILDAYKRSVKQTLTYIEKNYVETRIKRKGTMRREKTGSMVAALFQHDTSRNLDPQPHIHAVVANATQSADGKWRSVYNPPLWTNAKLFTQIQSAYFAKELTALGYGVEWKKAAGHLEVKDFPREVIEHFSTRQRDIQRVFATLDNKTHHARDMVALKTRPSKTKIAREELSAEWAARAARHGVDPTPDIDSAR
ncbi:MAG: MobF family relaxase, partial [Pseudomonadota bacterium]